MLGRGTSLLGSNALSGGLIWDVEDVQVLQRCVAARTSLVCVVAFPGHRIFLQNSSLIRCKLRSIEVMKLEREKIL